MLKSRYICCVFLIFTSLNADNLGSLMFHANCSTCHHETRDISAPSMMDVRKHYRAAFTKKKDFTKHMSKWVSNPDIKASIMPDSIKRYGIMPHLGFEEDSLQEIVEYIYDTDFK